MNPEEIIGRELEDGETRLWVGRPKQGVVFRAADSFMIPFSLLWGGFAVFWEVMAVRGFISAPSTAMGPVLIFPLFGIPFVLMGAYITVGRFFLDAKIREGTVYGVTDRRAIIVSGIWSREIKSLPLRTLSDITVTERTDGSGTITMGPSPPFADLYAGIALPGMQGKVATRFEMIPSAKQVYALMREGQR